MKKAIIFLVFIVTMLSVHAQVQYYLIVRNTNGKQTIERKLLNNNEYLSLLHQKSDIVHIQKEHKLTRHALPNDPLQNNQNFINELELPNLWNRSTGGLMRNNKEIIVAIIDDGIDTFHKDLKANIYINTNETGNNGIDDDGNGYIDDVIGWNSADSNGTIYSYHKGEHATPIAGIIGAQGNNDMGISGVNWKIKMLNVTCYGIINDVGEAAAFAGFEYIIRNKKMYLQSNGAKGINTHIINLSLGIENAFPDESPLWCSYMDTLKKLGILVCAATTNNPNRNIGIYGDLPATCASENMIVINQGTNVPISCGYSTQYVHLSANGTNVYSTQSHFYPITMDGYYNTFSGTSFSAPQLAGTAALIMSLACNSYLQKMADSPAVATALLKKWLLHTKYYPALANHTKTSGVLNARLAWDALDAWCIANDNQYKNTKPTHLKLPISPNPVASAGMLQIQLPQVKGTLSLYSVQGKCVMQQEINSNNVQLPKIAPGIYSLQLQAENIIYTSKLLINN